MGAPILINVPKNVLDPVKIAIMEFGRGVVPITVVRDGEIVIPKRKRG